MSQETIGFLYKPRVAPADGQEKKENLEPSMTQLQRNEFFQQFKFCLSWLSMWEYTLFAIFVAALWVPEGMQQNHAQVPNPWKL